MLRRPVTLVAITLLAALLPATAGGAATRPADGPTGTTTVVKIRIVDNRFRGGTITIDRGTVVKWVNRGSNTHTTTSDSGVWDSKNLVPGDVFRKKFRRAGTFAYHCAIHSSMTGTITVT